MNESLFLFIGILGPDKVLDIFFQGLVLVIGVIHEFPILDSFLFDVLDFVMELH